MAHDFAYTPSADELIKAATEVLMGEYGDGTRKLAEAKALELYPNEGDATERNTTIRLRLAFIEGVKWAVKNLKV